ncbi:hypothetical protein [Elizabethkingia anophelis]|uniref:hypothetical protein n=1 Tax=Elizabethkingia anophelis TaxID=1117645 RepID=UPI001624C432|nr:hypothetical protein [Elizabethkingia anophelis]
MMKKNTIFRSRITLLFLVMIMVFSCRSNDDVVSGGDKQATLKINLQGIDSGVQNLLGNGVMKMASVGNKNFAAPIEQYSEVAFNKDFKMIATLTPVTSSGRNTAKAAIGPMAAAIPAGPQELKIGTKYRIIVYSADGAWLGVRNYIYGQDLPEEGNHFPVNVGETLTFVCLSANSDTVSPGFTPTGVAMLIMIFR